MAQITVLGLDPGLGKTGYAIAEADTATQTISRVVAIGTLETEKSKLRTVRKTSDDLRRAKEHAAALQQVLAQAQIDLIATEMVTTTPYTYPTFSFGVMIGILASLHHPIIEVLPYEAKAAATGNNKASKREVISWALGLPMLSTVNWPITRRANNLKLSFRGANVAKIAEHPADALAVIQAGLRTEQLRLALSLFGDLPAASFAGNSISSHQPPGLAGASPQD